MQRNIPTELIKWVNNNVNYCKFDLDEYKFFVNVIKEKSLTPIITNQPPPMPISPKPGVPGIEPKAPCEEVDNLKQRVQVLEQQVAYLTAQIKELQSKIPTPEITSGTNPGFFK